MAQAKRKAAPKKGKKPARRKKKKTGGLSLKKAVMPLFLSALFLFSLCVLTYVIFFRVVVTA